MSRMTAVCSSSAASTAVTVAPLYRHKVEDLGARDRDARHKQSAETGANLAESRQLTSCLLRWSKVPPVRDSRPPWKSWGGSTVLALLTRRSQCDAARRCEP